MAQIQELTLETSHKIVHSGYVYKSKLKGQLIACV